jgi:hypothetical protein
VIGYLGSPFADDEYKNFTVPFLQGLKETGRGIASGRGQAAFTAS